MKVELKLTQNIKEPYAEIYSSEVNSEVVDAIAFLENNSSVITALDNERITVIQPQEIYMVRVENEQTFILCKNKKYRSPKRLYQLEQQLGKGFMRISKSVVINLKQIECVEPSFKGMMSIVLKNGCKDYISRHYMADFKKYLGL